MLREGCPERYELLMGAETERDRRVLLEAHTATCARCQMEGRGCVVYAENGE
jgi:hypothetical protein